MGRNVVVVIKRDLLADRNPALGHQADSWQPVNSPVKDATAHNKWGVNLQNGGKKAARPPIEAVPRLDSTRRIATVVCKSSDRAVRSVNNLDTCKSSKQTSGADAAGCAYVCMAAAGCTHARTSPGASCMKYKGTRISKHR